MPNEGGELALKSDINSMLSVDNSVNFISMIDNALINIGSTNIPWRVNK